MNITPNNTVSTKEKQVAKIAITKRNSFSILNIGNRSVCNVKSEKYKISGLELGLQPFTYYNVYNNNEKYGYSLDRSIGVPAVGWSR